MSIPKIIHQTFKSSNLPFLTRWHISKLRKKNPEYLYEFYDDMRIENFLAEEFDHETLALYKRLNIGAAKADFFRYAVLLKKGGVYLDIDCKVQRPLRELILKNDAALLSPEKNPTWFVQWAMIYEAGHPFLQKTMEMMCDNIRQNKFPHDVHKMTGPAVYSVAIRACLEENSSIPHRVFGVEYGGFIKDKYKLAKFFLYKNKAEHWKRLQVYATVLKS